MKQLAVTHSFRGFHIEGYPHAVKVVEIDTEAAALLADLNLHRQDLEFAADCLEELARVQAPDVPASLVGRALWQTALLTWAKCFASGVRRPMDPDEIYGSELEDGKVAIAHLQNLRNKHISHDVNAYEQSLPGAVINGPDQPCKVANVVCLSARAETLNEGSFTNLAIAIRVARAWVAGQMERMCETLRAELESEPREALLARNEMKYSKPSSAEKAKQRLPHVRTKSVGRRP